MSETQKFKYFSSVEGKIVPRFGTSVHIGAKRVSGGWEWDTKAIVAIPISEFLRHTKEYTKNKKYNALKEHTEKEYNSYLEALEVKAKADAEARADAKATEKAETVEPKAKDDEGSGENTDNVPSGAKASGGKAKKQKRG